MEAFLPLMQFGSISMNWNFVVFFLIGIAFGFILERAGFSSSRILVGTFYGYDTRVVKVFFTAAITAGLGLLYLSSFGFLDFSKVVLHPTFFWGNIVGGVFMGIGFITGGFCPGTALCASAIGKLDALIFSLGIFLGVFFFGNFYSHIQFLHKGYLWGIVNMSDFLNMSRGMFLLIFSMLGAILFWFAEYMQMRITGQRIIKKPRHITTIIFLILSLIAIFLR